MDGYTKYYVSLGSLPCGGEGGPIWDPQMAEMAKFEEFLISAKNKWKKNEKKMKKIMKLDAFFFW